MKTKISFFFIFWRRKTAWKSLQQDTSRFCRCHSVPINDVLLEREFCWFVLFGNSRSKNWRRHVFCKVCLNSVKLTEFRQSVLNPFRAVAVWMLALCSFFSHENFYLFIFKWRSVPRTFSSRGEVSKTVCPSCKCPCSVQLMLISLWLDRLTAPVCERSSKKKEREREKC